MAVLNPQATGTDVAAIVNSAQDLVRARFDIVQANAEGAINLATSFMAALQAAGNSFNFSVTRLNDLGIRPLTYSFNLGDAPIPPSLELQIPALPSMLVDDDLLEPLKAKILAKIAAGGTGLDQSVEDQIFRREYERELLALQESNERIADEWAKRGLPLPDGVLVQALTNAEIDFRNKRLDISRDIAVKQAELAWQQTTKGLEIGIALKQEIDSTMVARFQAGLEAFKSTLQVMLARIDMAVKSYMSEVESYKAQAETQTAVANVDIKAQETGMSLMIQQAGLFLKQAEINVQSFAESMKLRVAAAGEGGKMAAQMVAGILSGVSVQAHLGATGSAQESSSGQISQSESFPHKEIE